MSTDIRNAFQIALEYDGANGESLVFFSVSSRPVTYSLAHINAYTLIGQENTRLLRLGINGTIIILRAVTHRAARYWVDVRAAKILALLVCL